MKSQHQPVQRVVIDVNLLKVFEEYLGDRPKSDKRALDLHDRVVTLLTALGAL